MGKETVIQQWQTLGLQDLQRLQAAKDQAHQAAQIVGAVGRNLLPHHPWDIFGNLEWLPAQGMWAGWSIPGRFECRAALSPADLHLHLLSPNGHAFASFDLHGRTFAEGFAWMQQAITDFGIDAKAMKMELPYELPAYPQGSGTPFDCSDKSAFSDVAASFANAALVLAYVSENYTLWQHVRTWPHHFDISSRRRFAKGDGHWHMGVGYGPGGDHNYAEPYWHLTAYPSDEVDKATLPALPGDLQWQTENWLGVVLLWGDVVKHDTGAAQAEQVLHWVEKGMQLLAQVKAQ